MEEAEEVMEGQIDIDDCPHDQTRWVEEKINDHAQFVGYKCTACGRWVDEEEENE
jgi:transposase-like protein